MKKSIYVEVTTVDGKTHISDVDNSCESLTDDKFQDIKDQLEEIQSTLGNNLNSFHMVIDDVKVGFNPDNIVTMTIHYV